MQTIIDQNIWLQDKKGKFHYISAAHDIKLDFETSSIRFRIQAYGFSHGYVIGKFNNWQRDESLRIDWTADKDDASLWLTKNVMNINNLTPGMNQYSFILVDLDGNESTVSINDNSLIPLCFNWLYSSDKLEIKASEKFIVPGFSIDIVAVTESVTKRRSIVDVDWVISPENEAITIEDGNMKLAKAIDGVSQITISCSDKNNPSNTATRKFKIINEERNGSIVHFIKKDNEYEGDNFSWDLWTYSESQKTEEILLTYKSDFGLYAQCQKDNVIARKKLWSMHWRNDWSEQSNSFDISEKKNQYYIVYGDSNIYTSLIDVINRTNARITYAALNESYKIVAYLSDEPLVGTSFEIWINSVKVENTHVIVKYNSKKIIFTNVPKDIKAYDLVEIRANNTFMPTKVLMNKILDKFYYPNNDMGVVFDNSSISLRLWSPNAKKVELLLYIEDEVDKDKPDDVHELNYEDEYGTYHIDIDRKIGEHKYYMYRLYFDDLDPRGEKYTKITYAIDPYASGLGINGERGYLIDLNSKEAMPDDWYEENLPKIANIADAIIYETHLRDFTIDIESGIPEKLRGMFLGASQTGSKYIDEKFGSQVSTGIDSLEELGVTHIHLLPIFDFSSVDESKLSEKGNRNWGYDPKNYNAPDGCYSIDPNDPAQRIKGVRTMIAGFHKKGIGVIMDMVYNHMTDTSNLDKIVPTYYFRTDEFGNFTNGSGCGNELATERPMVSKFIQDSVMHWIKHYKIDGLRFDLMELIDLDTIKKIVAKSRQINPEILIYGEPWKAADSPLTNGTYRGTQKNENFSVFNDSYRDALRGNNNPGNGFVNGDPHNPTNIGNVIEGLKGSIHDLTAMPQETVNYVDAHDNYTLWDQIEKSQQKRTQPGNYRQHIPQEIFESKRVRQNALAVGIILTSQGIPFLHGGSEFLRTKQGDHNSYKSGDDINAFKWSDKLNYKPFFDYTKGLIEIRKEHPAFRMTSPEEIKKTLNITTAYHDNRSGVIVSHFKNNANGDSWGNIIIVYNATAIDGYDINGLLPIPKDGVWEIVANHEQSGTKTIQQCKIGSIPTLRSFSMMILHD